MTSLSPGDQLLVQNGGISAAERASLSPEIVAKIDKQNPDTAPGSALYKKAAALSPTAPPPTSVNNPQTITRTRLYYVGTVEDPQGDAKQVAIDRAAADGNTYILICDVKDSTGKLVDNFTVVGTPPKRDTDFAKKASGAGPSGNTTVNGVKQDVPPPSARQIAQMSENSQNSIGSRDAADEGDGKVSLGAVKNQLETLLHNVPRELGGVVPALEGIMMNIPQAALGKFTSLLPPAFKSLLPVGSIAGLVSKGAVSLSGLTNLVAGAALGQVAGQALRSLAGGPTAVSGLTGALGAQAIARVTGSTAIPVNISSTFGNALLSNVAGNIAGNAFGSSPQSAAVIANVVGVVTNVALNNRSGVPVGSQILGLAANVALKSAGVPTSIPTNILGLASNSALNPLASLIGSSVSARIPVLPGNLSLPNMGALSGLTQNLSPGLAENLIPPNQLASLLPGNLQAQIPAIPPRVSGKSPYIENDIGNRREASPASSGPVKPADNAEKKDALVKSGKGGPNGDYSIKISDHYTLSDLCITPRLNMNAFLRDQFGFTVDELIENLSWLAVNLIEPIRTKFPGFKINSGFDSPRGGSNRVGGSKHFFGQAVDLQWDSDCRNFSIQKDRAVWIVENLPIRGCLLEYAGSGIWIHVDGSSPKRAKEPSAKYWTSQSFHVQYGTKFKFDNPMASNSTRA
jgi:hypothetical protein